jgi:hypothetical protein
VSRPLAEGVYVAGRSFAAGDVPPEEYAALITNPRAWGDPVETDRKRPRAVAQAKADLYDPSAPGQGIDEVNNYLANADAVEVARVLAAEAEGKARKGVLEGPYAADEDPED